MKILQACKKEIKADLVLKNGLMLNMFTDEIIKGDLAITNGIIVGIGDYDGIKEIDCTNKYLAPGFIDAHMHIESTMLTPLELSKLLVSKGTTSIVVDPHEIVNVAGNLGLDYILGAVNNLPLDAYVMMPSCVPALDIDGNGAGQFLASDMKSYLNNEHILGLGEVMRFNDVINNEKRMQDKLQLFTNKIIDGHAPRIKGCDLQSYRLQGIHNDHECETSDEALEKLRMGFYLMIREGSAARNLESIISGLLDKNISFNRCLFCTDDKHIEDIENEGHIDYCVRKAISIGLNPIIAYKMASFHTASMYKMENKGALGVGYQADILIIDNLEDVSINTIIKKGNIVDDNYLNKFSTEFKDEFTPLLNTVNLPEISKKDLEIPLKNNNPLIKLVDNSLLTKLVYKNFDGEYFIPNKQYSKLCVIDRYNKTNNISCTILEGYNIENGAIASSISHDSHNLIVVGDNDDDIIKACSLINEMQGGFVVISNGKVLAKLQLNLGGLMSLENKEYVKESLEKVLETAYSLNVSKTIDPLITLTFISLGVIPDVRLLESGLYDVNKEIFIR